MLVTRTLTESDSWSLCVPVLFDAWQIHWHNIVMFALISYKKPNETVFVLLCHIKHMADLAHVVVNIIWC